MTSDVVARFVIRGQPYIAKAICCHWRRQYGRGPTYYECVNARPLPGGGGGVDKASMSKAYGLLIALYKHWFKSILKYNAAYYLITGALVSLYLARGLSSRTGFILLLPLGIGIGLATYARNCVTVIRNAEADIAELKTKLDAKVVPDMGYVVEMLRWSSRFLLAMVIGLGVLVLVCFIYFIQTGAVNWFFSPTR